MTFDSEHNQPKSTIKSQTRAIWIAAIASMLSFSVAVFSIGLSVIVYRDAKLADVEKIICSIDLAATDYKTVVERNILGSPVSMKLCRQVSLMNIRSKPVTVLSQDVAVFKENQHVRDVVPLLILDEQGTALQFSLYLQPGQKSELIYEIEQPLDMRAYKALEGKIPFDVESNIADVVTVLYNNGFDPFGNDVSLIRGSDGKPMIWLLESTSSSEHVELTVTTASGKQFKALGFQKKPEEHDGSYIRLQSATDKPIKVEV